MCEFFPHSSFVGKTSLMHRLVSNEFVETPPFQSMQRTILAYWPMLSGIVGANVFLQDTRADEADPFASNEFLLSGTTTILLVFDATNRLSFEHVGDWLQQVNQRCVARIPRFLVATKTGEPDLQVSMIEAEEWAASHSMAFFRTDARSGDGVQAMFAQVVHEAYMNHETPDEFIKRMNTQNKRSKCIVQ
jgi:GTPase SAR1 family protein